MRSGRLADLERHRLLRTRNFDREWEWPTQRWAWFQNFRARSRAHSYYMNPPSQNPRSATADQLKKTYGYDRKSKRPWIRLLHTGLDFAINNAHILCKHDCKRCKVKPKDGLDFRLELARLLLKKGSRCRMAACSGDSSKGKAQSESVLH